MHICSNFIISSLEGFSMGFLVVILTCLPTGNQELSMTLFMPSQVNFISRVWWSTTRLEQIVIYNFFPPSHLQLCPIQRQRHPRSSIVWMIKIHTIPLLYFIAHSGDLRKEKNPVTAQSGRRNTYWIFIDPSTNSIKHMPKYFSLKFCTTRIFVSSLPKSVLSA